MIDYSTIANTVGAFPNVVSQNATAPGATDGTPYLKSVIDDLWGARQALLDAAGMTPTGVTESATVSQQLEAIQKVAGYPGEVVAWMGNADPATFGVRMLPLTGQGILRASYPELDAAVYVGDPDNPTAEAFYHATDAGGTSRSTTGIYLILAETDSMFLRSTTGGRLPGEFEQYAIRRHGHDVYGDLGETVWPEEVPEFNEGTGTSYTMYKKSTSASSDLIATPDSLFGTALGSQSISDNDNYPDNIATTWAIRY